jgi:hypothetical protein
MNNHNSNIIICAIAKMENDYIREWVEFHLNLGFDKIYLGDNNDLDGERLEIPIIDYVESGKVEVLNYRGKVGSQFEYNTIIFNNKDFAWCAFIDIDEFITLEKHANIKDYISFIISTSNDCEAIALSNKFYNAGNQIYKKEGNVRDRFKDFIAFDNTYKLNPHSAVKSIIKKRNSFFNINRCHNQLEISYCNGDSKPVNVIDFGMLEYKDISWSTAYISHYGTKSLEEYIMQKLRRGRPENKEFVTDYFFIWNDKTPEMAKAELELSIKYGIFIPRLLADKKYVGRMNIVRIYIENIKIKIETCKKIISVFKKTFLNL